MNGSSKQTSQRTYLSFFVFHNHARLNQWIEFFISSISFWVHKFKTALRENNLMFTRIFQTRTVVYRNGCFTNSSHLGNQKHKKILPKHMYIPHDMFSNSSFSLNFYSSYYHFILLCCLILKTAITVKYLFLHGRQPNSLLKRKRVYYFWKAATFKEIFPLG